MLDQNTDRMWYVIGAVIVGAAIIFLVNSSFPQLFASVGDTFTAKVTDVSKDIDAIYPNARQNLYTNGDIHREGNAYGTVGHSIGADKESVMQKNIKIKPNTTYRITYSKNLKSIPIVLLLQNAKTEKTQHNAIYTDSVRVRELVTGLVSTQDAGSKTYTFTSGATEEYITLTTGNSGIVDVPFGKYVVDYKNIRLVEV